MSYLSYLLHWLPQCSLMASLNNVNNLKYIICWYTYNLYNRHVPKVRHCKMGYHVKLLTTRVILVKIIFQKIGRGTFILN